MQPKQKKTPSPDANFLFEEDIKPATFDRMTLAYVGAIMLHFSVLDDVISRALFKMANVQNAPGYMLIEQLGISAKMKRLGNLVQARRSLEQFQSFDRADKIISDIIQLRNTLAHGVYIGMAEEYYIFAMTTTFHGSREAPEIEGAVIYKRFNRYTREELEKTASEVIPQVINFLLVYFSLPQPREAHLQKKPEPQEAENSSESSDGATSQPGVPGD